MDLSTFFFYFLALLTALSAVMVVVTRNIVRSAAWLLFALAGTSGVFFLLGADFVGATQLLVYVGGTLVLVVFGVMLTAQGPFISMQTGAAEWGIATVAGVVLFAVLAISTMTTLWIKPDLTARTREEEARLRARARDSIPQVPPASARSSVDLGKGLLGFPAGPSHRDASDSVNVRTQYLLPFEIVSVHLLVVLIGAAYLARAKRRRGAS
jgi:NADH-quinone oxidoreductase subunit J